MLGMEFLVWAGIFGRGLIGGTLLLASLSKLQDRESFKIVVREFRLLPARQSQAVGEALPWLELSLGFALLLGILLVPAALLAVALFLVFAMALGVNLVRGHRNLRCGCFGSSTDVGLSWAQAGRALALGAVALLIVTTSPGTVASIRPDYTVSSAAAAEFVVVGLGVVTVLAWLAVTEVNRIASPLKGRNPAER